MNVLETSLNDLRCNLLAGVMTHHHLHVWLRVTVRSGHGHHRHHHHRYYKLEPNKEITFMTDVTVGHVVTDTILFLDQNGNPMLVTPAPDAPPVWTNAPGTPPVDSMSVSADGLTATITALAAGGDTIGVTVLVGGVSFAATQSLNIAAAPQVLTSVAIAASVA
jgi:hypothetical protein